MRLILSPSSWLGKIHRQLYFMSFAWAQGRSASIQQADPVAFAWSLGGFQGLSTASIVWCSELIYLIYKQVTFHDWFAQNGLLRALSFGALLPGLVSSLLYSRFIWDRESLLEEYDELSTELKSFYRAMAYVYYFIPFALFLVSFLIFTSLPQD